MKVITIGRSSQNDVSINDGMVSRHHCQITQHDDGSFSLSDFGSTNGTFVNGHQVHGEVRLNPTDVVRIGNTVLNWKNYFKREVPNKPTVSPGHGPTYTPKSNSTSSGSKSSALPIALILVGSIVVLILLIFAIVHKLEKIDRKPNPDPWRYENGVRTNVPEGGGKTTFEQTTFKTGEKTITQSGFSSVDLTGGWVWHDDGRSFHLYLQRQKNGRTTGTYETYWYNNEQDVHYENYIKENKSKNLQLEDEFLVKFGSGALGGRGTARVKRLSDDKISWKVQNIEGNCLVPSEAILYKKVEVHFNNNQ